MKYVWIFPWCFVSCNTVLTLYKNLRKQTHILLYSWMNLCWLSKVRCYCGAILETVCAVYDERGRPWSTSNASYSCSVDGWYICPFYSVPNRAKQVTHILLKPLALSQVLTSQGCDSWVSGRGVPWGRSTRKFRAGGWLLLAVILCRSSSFTWVLPARRRGQQEPCGNKDQDKTHSKGLIFYPFSRLYPEKCHLNGQRDGST